MPLLHINKNNIRVASLLLLFYGYIFQNIYGKSSLFDEKESLEKNTDCKPEDLLYRYTECDETGRRWRFATPRFHSLKCRNVPSPVPGLNCSFSCPAGNFLDMEKQICRRCPPGTYSLGDGVRYEEFSNFPPGFSSENIPDETELIPTGVDAASESNQNFESCSTQSSGWIIQNGELRYVPTACVAVLSISLNLKRNGYIQLYYKMPKNSRSLLAILQIKNAQCQNYGDPKNMLFQAMDHRLSDKSSTSHQLLSSSIFHDNDDEEEDMWAGDGSDFRIRKLHLRAGQNLVKWTIANNRELTTLADIIYVPKIEIFGLAYTSSCTSCPAGTFSNSGAEKCEICASGSFSKKGSTHCQTCSYLNEYSHTKASKCELRPKCELYDYYPKMNQADCKTSNTSSIKWQRIQPKICLKNDFLNFKQDLIQCNNICNPGMQWDAIKKICDFCANDNEYSPDGKECLKCSNDSMPLYGLYFTKWHILPSEISTSCEYLTSDEIMNCDVLPSWITLNNRIESAQTRAVGVALELNIKINSGFYDPLRMSGINTRPTIENPISELELDLETRCQDFTCQLYIIKDPGNSTILNLYTFLNGTLPRQHYRFPILDSRPTTFVIIFMRGGANLDHDIVTDHAIIYSLNITNTGNSQTKLAKGGAVSCRKCVDRDEKTKKCKACAPGHYVDFITNKCIQCPHGTALNVTAAALGLGINSCVKCGPNLGADDGSQCTFSGKFQLISTTNNKTMKFDYTPLKNQILKADGIKVFAREGNAYFHSFNVSIFGEPIQCADSIENSISSLGAISAATITKYTPVEMNNGIFCRAAAIPASKIANQNLTNYLFNNKNNNNVLYVSSLIISRRIAAVTQARSYGNFRLSNDQLEYENSLASTQQPFDVHIFYATEQRARHSQACPNGSAGVVTMRCEATLVKNPLVRLSRKCPDGTCDGCLYHLIIESSFACPICHPDDFEEIRGECLNNKQRIHYIPSTHCVLSGAQNHERVIECSNVPRDLAWILISAAFLITCLIVTVCIFYQKNKTLEYRYMRIIEGKETNTVNSCAIKSDDDEEDDDEEEEGKEMKENKAQDTTRVFFGKQKNNCIVSVASSKSKSNKRKKNAKLRTAGTRGAHEVVGFLGDEEDDDDESD